MAVVAIATLAFTGSCGSSTLPPPVGAAQRARISTTHFHVTVGVEPYAFPIYSKRLIERLRATKLFDRVDDLSKFSSMPDLIARVEQPVYGSPTFPVKTFLTAGILSTSVTEQYGEVFSLRSGVCKDMIVPITYKYTGEVTLGWWAVILNLEPDRTKHDPSSHANYREGLAWRIVREADAFIAMKRQGC